jgi:hypothetical protein
MTNVNVTSCLVICLINFVFNFIFGFMLIFLFLEYFGMFRHFLKDILMCQYITYLTAYNPVFWQSLSIKQSKKTLHKNHEASFNIQQLCWLMRFCMGLLFIPYFVLFWLTKLPTRPWKGTPGQYGWRRACKLKKAGFDFTCHAWCFLQATKTVTTSNSLSSVSYIRAKDSCRNNRIEPQGRNV